MTASDPAHRLLHAQTAASRLPAILVAARQVAATVALGGHGRRRSGMGDDFWQFRPYGSGDSIQSIDWRQTAKSDRAFVREREHSSVQTVYLWRSTASGMTWRSQGTLETKQARADLLLLALAILLHKGGEHLGFLDATTADLRQAQACHSPELLALRLSQPLAQAELPPPVALPRRASVVLISDWLAPLIDLKPRLHALAHAGLQGHVVQVLDPAEEAFPFQGRTRFSAPGATGAQPELLVPRAEDLREDYQHRLRAHRAELAETARALGWSFLVHHTDRSPQQALTALFQALTTPRFAPGEPQP